MTESSEIPKTADKILFAEDLVNYVMNYIVETTYIATSAERHRDFIYNAFNETVREAVTFIYNELHMENENFYLVMLHINSVNLQSYATYAKNVINTCFNGNFDARSFLHYCVRLAGVAVYFYKHGIIGAPYLAITYIVNVLNNIDMTSGGWATLNTVCGQIANIKNDNLNQQSEQPTSEKGTSVSSGECSCFMNEYKFQIRKVFAEALRQLSNSSSSPENKEDFKKFKYFPVSFQNSSNFGENKVVNEPSSNDAFPPGTTNTTGMPVCSTKVDNLDLSLKEIKHESEQNVPPPTGKEKSGMLEVTSKSEIPNSEQYIFNALNNINATTGGGAILNAIGEQIANIENDTLNQLSQQPTSEKGTSVSSAGCSCFINEYKFQIQKVFAEALRQLSDSNSSSNSEENKVVNEPSSNDIFVPGTTNTTEMSDCSTKVDNLDLSLKEINHESDQKVPPPTGERKSSMLEVTSKSEIPNSDQYIVNALNNINTAIGGGAILNAIGEQIANIENDTLNQLSQQPTSEKGTSVSSAGCSCFMNEYKFQIETVFAEALRQLSNSNSSSNSEENKVVNETLSNDIFVPGTTNITGMSVRSTRVDNLDLPLKEINDESDQKVSSTTGEKKSSMLEVSS